MCKHSGCELFLSTVENTQLRTIYSQFRPMPDLPEKPSGDRDTLTIRELDLVFETPNETEIQNFTDLDREGHLDPETTNELLQRGNTQQIRRFWDGWLDTLFNHVHAPTALFDTTTKTVNDVPVKIVSKDTFGRSKKPVLKRSEAFTHEMNHIGKRIVTQYVLTADVTPATAANNVPYNFQSFDIIRLREFAEEYPFVWMNDIDAHWTSRTPVGNAELQGMIYIMYTVRDDELVPRYIGMSQRDSIDGDSLNWNFENIEQDSVFGRWGYGSSQHLGELSKAMFPKAYDDDPEKKYQTWLDELFVDGTRVLSEQLYIELLPWFQDNLYIGEENLVKIASHLYGDELLNVEYTY